MMTEELAALAAQTFEAMQGAGWRVDERLRVLDEHGDLLAESVDLTELAGFFGLLGRERAAAA